jgi:chaperonin GroEL
LSILVLDITQSAEIIVETTLTAFLSAVFVTNTGSTTPASINIVPSNTGETLLLNSIKSPFITILDNAGIEDVEKSAVKGMGIDVTTGEHVNMIEAGVVDPVLVTKTALKNAVSVVSTIISADCVISNTRIDNASS